MVICPLLGLPLLSVWGWEGCPTWLLITVLVPTGLVLWGTTPAMVSYAQQIFPRGAGVAVVAGAGVGDLNGAAGVGGTTPPGRTPGACSSGAGFPSAVMSRAPSPEARGRFSHSSPLWRSSGSRARLARIPADPRNRPAGGPPGTGTPGCCGDGTEPLPNIWMAGMAGVPGVPDWPEWEESPLHRAHH